MIGFIVDVEFVWGFQANDVGSSKTPSPFYYPPPTTFLGALSESIAKDHGLPEKDVRESLLALSKELLAVGLKPLNCLPVKYEDINRIIAIKRTAGVLCPTPADLRGSFDSPARGKTILISRDGEAPKIRWVLIFRNPAVKISDKEFPLAEDYFWGIHRIGSKESLVSVVNVETSAVEPIKDNEAKDGIETTYSFPVEAIHEILREGPTSWASETYINPFDFSGEPVKDYKEGRKLMTYRIPLKEIDAEYYCIVKLSEKGVAYKHKDGIIIGWQRPPLKSS